MSVVRIVSGGQTGADRAALDVANELGIATGGWVPRGRRAEDGAIPDRYTSLAETDSPDYSERTRLNVRDSDATLILTFGLPAGGTALTIELANEMCRPCLVIDLETKDSGEAARAVRDWLLQVQPEVLNVAGPRLSEAPGIADAVSTVLTEVFSNKRVNAL